MYLLKIIVKILYLKYNDENHFMEFSEQQKGTKSINMLRHGSIFYERNDTSGQIRGRSHLYHA